MNRLPLYGLIQRNGFHAGVGGMMSPALASPWAGLRRKGGKRSSVLGTVGSFGAGKLSAPFGLAGPKSVWQKPGRVLRAHLRDAVALGVLPDQNPVRAVRLAQREGARARRGCR